MFRPPYHVELKDVPFPLTDAELANQIARYDKENGAQTVSMEYTQATLHSSKGCHPCVWAHPLFTYIGTAPHCRFFRKHRVWHFDALWHRDSENTLTRAQR